MKVFEEMKSEKSSSTKIKEEDEPPDSLGISVVKKNTQIKQVEPEQKLGSFLIPENQQVITIKPGFNDKGIRLNVMGMPFDIVYPKDIWQKYPQFYKKILSENLAFALTFHLPYLYKVNSLNYLMARPISESFFFKAFILALPSTALMKKESSSGLIKKLFEIEYCFIQEKNILTSNLPPRETNKTAILAFSFGKDSLLTYSLCRELGIKTVPIFIKEPLTEQENFHKEKLREKFLKESYQDVLMIDNQVGELREPGEGWYGWELQLTQYALMILPIVYANKARYLFFANEQSCNDGFLNKEGFWCNPVYEQSAKWTEQIGDLVQLLGIKNLKVGSLIEPIHEIAIIKILHHRYPEIAKYQTSCFAEKPEAKINRWCGNCSKCARMYIFFLANNINPVEIGIPTNMLELKYKHKFSLFEDGNIKDSGYDQSGLGRDEQLLAFLLAYRNGYKGELMDLFKSLYLKEAVKREKELREKFFGIHSTNTIPKELKDKVLNIYREELKNLS